MTSNENWGKAPYYLKNGDETSVFYVSGRERWALENLIQAGNRGCTPLEQIGPRWSAYVHLLRGRGLDIETITEPHAGPFAGHHARYVLRSTVLRGLAAAA